MEKPHIWWGRKGLFAWSPGPSAPSGPRQVSTSLGNDLFNPGNPEGVGPGPPKCAKCLDKSYESDSYVKY